VTLNTINPTAVTDEINLNMILSSSKMSRMSDFPPGGTSGFDVSRPVLFKHF
jgi:hypothetical protein